MIAVVRQIGKGVCYTFEDSNFFICEMEEAEEDLKRANEVEDNTIEVDDILYTLAR
jgi:hypothetical protein